MGAATSPEARRALCFHTLGNLEEGDLPQDTAKGGWPQVDCMCQVARSPHNSLEKRDL